MERVIEMFVPMDVEVQCSGMPGVTDSASKLPLGARLPPPRSTPRLSAAILVPAPNRTLPDVSLMVRSRVSMRSAMMPPSTMSAVSNISVTRTPVTCPFSPASVALLRMQPRRKKRALLGIWPNSFTPIVVVYFVQVPGAWGIFNGDFNYEGVIDGGDDGIIDNTSQAQGAAL